MDDYGGIHRDLLRWNVSHRILSAKSSISDLCAMYSPRHACHIRNQLLKAENFQIFLPSINQNQRFTHRATAYFLRSARRRDHSSKST